VRALSHAGSFQHDILQIDCPNSTRFAISVQFGTKKNLLDFEIKRSKAKVTDNILAEVYRLKVRVEDHLV